MVSLAVLTVCAPASIWGQEAMAGAERPRSAAQRQDALSRRYAEGGAAVKALRLPTDDLLAIYGEVLAAIQSHYFEEVDLNSLLSQGLDQVEMALGNRAFRAAALPAGVSLEAVDRQRAALRLRWDHLTASDRRAAQQQVKSVALGLRQDLGVKPAAVVLEFLYAACEALDPYSAYLPPEQFLLEKALAEKDIAGIGIELRQGDEHIFIDHVAEKSPAEAAGVQPNEQLLAIDGRSVRSLNLEEAALRLFGTQGTSVTLEVQGATDRQPRKLELVRQRLAIPSISDARIVDLEAGVGYVHLALFQTSTLEELDNAIARLGEQGMRVLILDLRGNSGGLLVPAVQVADRFVSNGILVMSRGRSPGANAVYRAPLALDPPPMGRRSRSDAVITAPLVVLIDGETASGAEVVAGAVKDHHRGVLVGQKSAGKGSMQYIFPLRWRSTLASPAGEPAVSSGSSEADPTSARTEAASPAEAGLRLTTAALFSPLDYPYNGHGVLPDVTVDRLPDMADPQSMMTMLQLQQLQFEAALRAARELAGR
jgi:carboxyl-terminal processing protease